ncbi:MAG TPA: VWA domain-containing protein [Pontiella sp.]
MPIYFYNPGALLWLWVIPFTIALFLYAGLKRKQAMQAFGGEIILISRRREALGSCIAITLIILALSRPAWNLEEQQLNASGRDVIFLLDVSRSMLAEDLYPSRLENAKIAILDCIEDLSGDRIGLVLFAGSSEIRCPLTVDYDYFRMALRQASPESIAVGGTMIAPALERTLDKLGDPERAGLQDIILISDGEDQVEGPDEIEATQKLQDAGIRLIAIGIGDRIRGSRISQKTAETDEQIFMKHGNVEVWTRLHSETLQHMASSIPEGIYFDVGTNPFDLAHIYQKIMKNAQQSSTSNQTIKRYEEKFHLFLGSAVIILLVTYHRRKRP